MKANSKKYTLLAVELSKGLDLKPVGDKLVYLQYSRMLDIKKYNAPLVFHMCKPFKLVKALTEYKNANTNSIDPTIFLYHWQNYCGLLFENKDNMFCSKCFEEFPALSKKIAIIKAAETKALNI